MFVDRKGNKFGVSLLSLVSALFVVSFLSVVLSGLNNKMA